MPSNASVKEEKENIDLVLRSGLAGGVAGCAAKTVVAPLDRVKILFQTSNPEFSKYAGHWTGAWRAGKEIYKDYGVLGLFQGHSATLLRIFPYAAIKYMFYDQIHLALMPTREQETNLRRFAAGSLSGTLSVCCTYPLELTRVRLAYITRSRDDRHRNPSNPTSLRPTASATFNPTSSSPNPGSTSHSRSYSSSSSSSSSRPRLRHAISDIYRETRAFPPTSSFLSELRGGSSPAVAAQAFRAHLFYHFPVLSFYRGFTVTLLGMVPYAGTSFLTWGYLRSIFLPRPPPGQPRQPTPVADLVIGAIAGAASQSVSYPFEVIRRRMQVGGLTNPDPRAWMTFAETVERVWRSRGWRGFYVGLGIGLAKVVPMTATSFAVWQWGKRVLGVA